MRIVWLLESAAPVWGGVLRALDAADRLAARGHEVLVLSKDAPNRPDPRHQRGAVRRQVASFDAETVPACDVVVATFWTTVQAAVQCRRGTPVHYCQGYEPLGILDPALRARAESAYRLPTHKIAISPHLATRLREIAGHERVEEIVYAVDHEWLRPPEESRAAGTVVRVGIVGPWNIPWKGIRTGVEACRLALQSGLALRLVRVSAFEPDQAERALGVPTEWHTRVPPERMGEIYRGLDVLLGTSTGPEEGFFLPAVEAMACGVPCVLTDIPCFQGYATDRSDYALFVEPQNVHEMAEALTLAACHSGLRQQLSAAGLEVAKRFQPDRHITELEAALEHIVDGSTAPAQRCEPQIDVERVAELPAATPQSQVTAPDDDDDALEAEQLVAALRHRGDRLLLADRFDESLAAFEAALRLRPQDLELQDRIGSAAFLAGDAERALTEFDRLLGHVHATDPAARVWHEKRGLVLIGLDRWQEAARAFERAARCTDADADTFNSFGVALHELGDVAGARQAFRQALQHEPSHVDASRNLAELC